ncbi:gliding motility-associated C-terminal domain-containing protein [Fulvivirgaceae bacterium BMA10]|uniref:Gliding motility-associated C-terminal domain-containing protein n=1 Tax=Splendidivirga corallicola TaxID=3051826 RepID=A0ABT8KY85_9BACT|nr:gliding motility-associated C-terminal domain-containing protein [Fulvivirgaceae bacterium BMA10]
MKHTIFIFIVSLYSVLIPPKEDKKKTQVNQKAELSFTIEKTDIKCPGDATGSAEVIITGGTPPFIYHWSTDETTAKIENLFAGTYFVEVEDSDGNFLTRPVQINEPQEITIDFQVKNLFCFGESNGSIDMTVTGGTQPYSFEWSNGETTEDLENIQANEYFITITDANNCTVESSVIVSQPSELKIAYSLKEVSCNGGSDGEIDVSVFGGVAPYIYSWSNGQTTQDLFDLSSGELTLSITDANNCTLEEVINVPEPDALGADFQITNVTCNGEDGKIDLTVLGGVPPFSFKWSNSVAILNDVTEDLGGLETDTYTVEITDGNGCTFISEAFVDLAPLINVVPEVSHISCIGANDGAITLQVSGGTAPYAYLWSTGSREQGISDLKPGDYGIIVADAAGCTSEVDLEIIEPKAFIYEVNVTPASCDDIMDGAIDLFVGGGTPPFTYSWSDGSTGTELANLPSGTYELTVSDVNGCTEEKSVNVPLTSTICLEVPKAFSPNGDLINDTWIINQTAAFPNLTVQVFNRWGEQLFSSHGYARPWDGSHKGKIVPSGTYYYLIDLGTAGKSVAGSITIVK